MSEDERRERALRAKILNDRLKSLASIGQGVVLILLGIGFLRFTLDPNAPSVGPGQVLLTLTSAIAIEVLTLYILGLQDPEE